MKTDLGHTVSPHDAKRKPTGIVGIALGAFALLACLACGWPIIVAILGLAGLSASAEILPSSPMVTLAAIMIATIGAALLTMVITRRLLRRRRWGQG